MKITTIAAVAVAALSIGAGGAVAGSTLTTSAQIKDGTILARDLSPSLRAQIARPGPRGVQGAQGVEGLPGLQGFTGIQGPAGLSGTAGANGVAGTFDPSKIVYVTGPSVLVLPYDVETATANCPPGAAAISGGYFASITNPGALLIGPASVSVIVNNDTPIAVNVHAYAVCSY